MAHFDSFDKNFEIKIEDQEYAFEDDCNVLQDTISRLQDQLDRVLEENTALSLMNARFELENASLKAELLDIKSTIGSSIASEVSKVTAIEVSKATSALSAQLECLSQTVKAQSDHLVNAKIVDRRALSKDSIDPRDLYLDSDTSWAAKSRLPLLPQLLPRSVRRRLSKIIWP